MSSSPKPLDDPRGFLECLFAHAVEAAHPATCVVPHLPPPPANGRTLVIAIGKAAAAMAAAVESVWSGPISGIAVTRYGHGAQLSSIRLIEASHPVPDRAGEDAARALLDLAASATPDDLLLCLISGGGSALTAIAAPGIAFDEKVAINRALLRSGATIEEINCVRKHISAIKGGRLAAASGTRNIVNLIISDVPGDAPETVAGGPTLPDPSTLRQARDVLCRYAIAPSPAIQALLARDDAETPKPGDAGTVPSTTVIASAATALEAARAWAEDCGVEVELLGDAIEGEARQVGSEQASRALSRAGALRRPLLLLSGGETTVTVVGNGRGGRNAEFALALALVANGHPAIHALAADSDGIDGTEDNAGAIVGPATLERCRAAGIDPTHSLAANDAYSALEAAGDLVKTGPTRTNVNDIRAVLILPEREKAS